MCNYCWCLQELAQGGGDAQLSAGVLDQVLLARLIEEAPADYPLAPVPYLLGCYRRALDLPASAPGGSALAQALKDAIVAHIWLCLDEDGLVAQPPAAQQRGALQLFDALWAAVPHATGSDIHTGAAAPVTLPAGLLHHSLQAFPDETKALLEACAAQLGQYAGKTSILGDFHAIDSCWFRLLDSKDVATAVAASAALLPRVEPESGRDFEASSPLAQLFSISMLPDPMAPVAQPSVMDEVWLHQKGPAAAATVAAPSNQHASALQQLVGPKALLSAGARPHTVRWLAKALTADTERSKMQPQRERATSNGFAHNFLRLMLHLCAPFLDVYNGKAVQHVDVRCVSDMLLLAHIRRPQRLHLADHTFASLLPA